MAPRCVCCRMEGGEAAAVCEGGKVYPGVTAVTRGCGGGALWPPRHDKVGSLASVSNVKPNTLQNVRTHLRRFFAHTCGALKRQSRCYFPVPNQIKSAVTRKYDVKLNPH